jgi:hypothetical protein
MISKLNRLLFIALLFFACVIFTAFNVYKHHWIRHMIVKKEEITLVKTFNFPDILIETSGLIYYRGLVWSFNDSGGEPEIYSYSMDDSFIKQRITLWNGKNYDWEEIAQDSSCIYVGDFGNNFGIRNNLCIYIVDKNDLPKHKNKAVKAGKIHFTYPDYTPVPLSFNFKRSAFDCESMICLRDSIYLFTKNWVSNTSSIYQIPKEPGKYIAKKIGVFDCKGLITAASLKNDQLVLLGYANNMPFIWRFNHFTNPNLKPSDGIRYDISCLKGKQTEGIAIVDSVTYLVSAEKTTSFPQLFVLKITH